MLKQNTQDIGIILLQWSLRSTSISGLTLSNLIAMYAPIAEQIKWMHDTVRGNVKSSFCICKKQKKWLWWKIQRKINSLMVLEEKKKSISCLIFTQSNFYLQQNNKQPYDVFTASKSYMWCACIYKCFKMHFFFLHKQFIR